MSSSTVVLRAPCHARAGARRLARGMTPACGAPSLFMERLEIGIDDIVEYRSSR